MRCRQLSDVRVKYFGNFPRSFFNFAKFKLLLHDRISIYDMTTCGFASVDPLSVRLGFCAETIERDRRRHGVVWHEPMRGVRCRLCFGPLLWAVLQVPVSLVRTRNVENSNREENVIPTERGGHTFEIFCYVFL